MEKLLIFDSAKEVRFGKLLKFIIPTYLTALFNTVYTIVDGIFVSSYVGTNALAAINIVYPIVNILTGIALEFATGGSALAALHIGGERKEEANRTFSVSMLLSPLLCICNFCLLGFIPVFLWGWHLRLDMHMEIKNLMYAVLLRGMHIVFSVLPRL